MTPRPFQRAARRFLIWRFGQSVKWRCSYSEIAEAVGASIETVRRDCHRYGYDLSYDHREDMQRREVVPVDAFFQKAVMHG